MPQYSVTVKKKDGTVYEGIMTVKEPQLVNGMFALARANGGWKYLQPDTVDEIDYEPVEETDTNGTDEPQADEAGVTEEATE